MQCPRCGLINDPSASRCDCGLVFPRGDHALDPGMQQEREDRRSRGKFSIAVGLTCIAVSLGGFAYALMASFGGRWILAWGIALVGGRQVAAGWRDYREL